MKGAVVEHVRPKWHELPAGRFGFVASAILSQVIRDVVTCAVSERAGSGCHGHFRDQLRSGSPKRRVVAPAGIGWQEDPEVYGGCSEEGVSFPQAPNLGVSRENHR